MYQEQKCNNFDLYMFLQTSTPENWGEISLFFEI